MKNLNKNKTLISSSHKLMKNQIKLSQHLQKEVEFCPQLDKSWLNSQWLRTGLEHKPMSIKILSRQQLIYQCKWKIRTDVIFAHWRSLVNIIPLLIKWKRNFLNHQYFLIEWAIQIQSPLMRKAMRIIKLQCHSFKI